ncbi:MAG: hypothetical protein MJZ60_01000 [Bacteroidaceae bacterium]|nr:hypothetical protein [Bacteroidaceae bacterium]
MRQARTKIFHLEMEGQHYYFGSPKAIFDIMGEEKMGMKYSSFHSNITLKPGDVYTNRRHGYIIRVGLLGQAKTNRSNRWQEIMNANNANLNAQAQPEANVQQEVVAQPEAEVKVAQAQPTTKEAPAATPEAAPVHKPRSKKKNADIPEQLTLF